MLKHIFLLPRLLLVGAVLLGSGTLFAQELPRGAFIVRPAKTELNLSPGESKVAPLSLFNGTESPLHVEVSFEDIAPKVQRSFDDDATALLGEEAGKYPLRELLQTPRSSFDVLSGKEVVVPITVTTPKNREAGGRYGSVIFTFSPILSSSREGNANVALNSRVATLFYVRVNGEVKEEGKLAAFGLFNNALFAPSPREGAPLRFQVAYENTGTVHVNPYGRLTTRSILGKEEMLIVAPFAVLPEATRMLEVDLASLLRPGYYTAHLELNRGYGNIVDEKEVSFWIIPSLKQALLGLVALILLGWLLKRSIRLSRHWVKQ